MNQGDKKVFRVVGLVFVAVIALTVYLEIQHQQTQESGLTTSKKISELKAKQAKQVTVIPSGLNPDNLPDADSRGATMLTLYCAQCHELPSPAMHTRIEWDNVLERMQAHMKTTRGNMLRKALMPPEKDWLILKTYLENHGQVPLDKTTTSDLDTDAGKAFKSTCSQCHAPPNPKTHSRNEWPRVVLRMKSHIIRTGKKMPDQDTLMQIIDYLQKHSKTTQS